MVKPGKYEHFKGKQYEVLFTAKNSETLEDFVVYRALYGNNEIWIRPLKMFQEQVEHNGKLIPRFKYMDENGG